MKTKLFEFVLICSVMYFIHSTVAVAATIPIANVDVLIKSIIDSRVVVGNTDSNGNFSTTVPEENGTYNVFISDENLPPVKIVAKNGTISGRVVILTDGTTTKDPTPPVAVKKSTPVKTTKPVTKKVTANKL